MADDKIELEGTVVDALPGSKFKVEVDIPGKEEKHYITGSLSGRLRQNHIRILVGDTVVIKVSPYDFSNGIITWRNK